MPQVEVNWPFPHFDPPFPPEDEIAAYRTRAEHGELALYIAKKVTTLLGLVARSPTDASSSDFQPCNPVQRDEAIERGLLVRIRKLLDSAIVLASEDQGDFLYAFARMIFESAVNLAYLLKHGEYDEFVCYSLLSELDLLSEVKKNTSHRGKEAAIEETMRTSIEKSFDTAGVTIAQVRARRRSKGIGLFGKTIEERAIEVGLGTKHDRRHHLGGFSMPSHNIHGNWEDLRINHLLHDNGSFTPYWQWNPFEPELLLVPTFVVLGTVERFSAKQSYEGDFKGVVQELTTHSYAAIEIALTYYNALKYETLPNAE